MPNLQQIQSLREKYIANNNIYLSDIKLLAESFNRSTFEIKSLFVNNGKNQNLVNFFESQQSADVVLLFIDITNVEHSLIINCQIIWMLTTTG